MGLFFDYYYYLYFAFNMIYFSNGTELFFRFLLNLNLSRNSHLSYNNRSNGSRSTTIQSVLCIIFIKKKECMKSNQNAKSQIEWFKNKTNLFASNRRHTINEIRWDLTMMIFFFLLSSFRLTRLVWLFVAGPLQKTYHKMYDTDNIKRKMN